MGLKYKIYSGTGNILAVVEGVFPQEQVVGFCSEHSLDGILCLTGCSSADVFMRIFNANGKEAEMCGNGLRIVIQHLFFKTGRMEYGIATLSGIYRGYIDNDGVVVNMTRSFWNFRRDIRLAYEHKTYVCHFINTGVPHVVIFSDDRNVDVHSVGAAVCSSKIFSPEGVNVNFVFGVKDPHGLLLVRTYERGVEKETGACGTGATASALVASKIYGLPSPVKILTTSQEYLTVSFDFLWNKVMLSGSVKLIKEGTVYLNTHVVNC